MLPTSALETLKIGESSTAEGDRSELVLGSLVLMGDVTSSHYQNTNSDNSSFLQHTVYVEILASIKFGDMALNRSFKNIGGILI